MKMYKYSISYLKNHLGIFTYKNHQQHYKVDKKIGYFLYSPHGNHIYLSLFCLGPHPGDCNCISLSDFNLCVCWGEGWD